MIPEAGQLAHATLDSISELLHEALNVPESLGAVGLHALARRFRPTAVAEELGLRTSSVADRVLTTAIGRVTSYRAKLRRDPARWKQAQQHEIEATREFIGTVTDPLYGVHNTNS